MFHSELHLQLTDPLGINIQVQKRDVWKCPFGYCHTDVPRYSHIQEHIISEHTAHEKHLYSKVGGFWPALSQNFHRWGKWSNINEIFFHDEQQVRILLTLLE
jgi:hypothetical protein